MELRLTNQILHNQLYQQGLAELRALEAERPFCRHDIEHFLSVARLALLLCRERGVEADADLLYAAALLHDMGRVEEARTGTPHDIAGTAFAERILEETDCNAAVKLRILSLIANHRDPGMRENSLEAIFCLADKRSRLCFACEAWDQCYWSMERRNTEIRG